MPDSDIFISSCSRRQLARRRPGRAQMRLQLTLAMVVLLSLLAAFIAGRGGV
jgi:hypothetical protein